MSVDQNATIVMRTKCGYCGGADGVVTHKNGQALVYCAHRACGKYQYNAPKWELDGEMRPDPERWIEPGLTFQPHYTYLYRVWSWPFYKDASFGGGKTYTQHLLYVGVTNNPKKRLRQHAGLEGGDPKPWADIVGGVTFEMHHSRTQALLAEARAIQYEKPLYNVHYSTTARWNCESSHCQVVTMRPAFSNNWFDARRLVDLCAIKNAQIDGDPVVFRYLHFVWLAVDLPKVRPYSLHEVVVDPSVVSVQALKPAGFPVPEPLPDGMRLPGDRPEFAPDFVKRVEP